MSSAAVQQSTTQTYHQTPQGRDRYSSDPSAIYASASPASRRSGRSGSRNAADAPSTPASSSTITPSRGQTVPASGSAMNTSTYDQFYPDSNISHAQPTSLPIRTSAQQPAPSSGAYDSRQYASSQQYDGNAYNSEADRERWRGHRSPQQSPAQQPGSGKSQRTRQAPTESRSQTAVGQPPMGTSLPRENSAIINHIVVDDPQSDIARERARIVESQPRPAGANVPSAAGLGLVGEQGVSDSQRPSTGQRSRQEHLKTATPHRKEVKFGDYILGQTLGEGEFGKVKMGWKKEGGVQVAIKFVRKESLAGNATRLPKIYREIAILKELEHPNIVRLHEFLETERQMGIILEYASGGELFDYILNHRYLKDPAARRLFAQLVSGVGYLHKKGIVHRDLKLENLLLDRHKNIIITDFGFANTFNPTDELGEEVEHSINDKDFVRRRGLDAVGKDGLRRGDLMQTSCGSPCYAAPELVVSDGLYTGRKVDVWSCGVILYAMLAGYLPFDDDPANPEGDNINLLYKYIVSTPLTFPEYVTPHARDLLRRILVPDPRRRADLFEVARHSWLSEYSHLVGFIGSSSKTDKDIAASAVDQDAEPMLGRSASVREPSNRSASATVAAGGSQKQASEAAEEKARRDAKRRTVQVEYVAPNNPTTRGETSPIIPPSAMPIAGTGRTRARPEGQGPVEVAPAGPRQQIPRKEIQSQMPPPVRPSRDQARTTSDSTGAFAPQPITTASRPNTRGTLPSRGNSYGQPVIATPTTENAQGRFTQPRPNSGYMMSGSRQSPPPTQTPTNARPSSQQQMPPPFLPPNHVSKSGHKRSSTLSSITDRVLGRSNSRRRSQQVQEGVAPAQQQEKRDRKYPPVSMNNAKASYNTAASSEENQPRRSTDSRRSSFNFLRKNSQNPDAQQQQQQPADSRRNSRRFSFLPNNFSMSSFTGKKDQNDYSTDTSGRRDSMQRSGRPASKGMAFGRGTSRSPSQSTTASSVPAGAYHEESRDAQRGAPRRSGMPPQQGSSEKYLPQLPSPAETGAGNGRQYGTPPPVQRKQFRDDGYGGNALDPSPNAARQQEPVERYYTPSQGLDAGDSTPQQQHQQQAQAQPSYRNDGYNKNLSQSQPQQQRPQQQQQQQSQQSQSQWDSSPIQPDFSQGIRPTQRKFADGYQKGHEGSTSTARRVMDLFRRRGRDRNSAAVGGQ